MNAPPYYKARYRMAFDLPKIKTLKNGSLIARYAIPADVRDEYQRRHGKGWEERWTAKPGTPEWPQRRQLYAKWIAEISGQIVAIRAANEGEDVNLSREDAAALAGEWYQWFTDQHESNLGAPTSYVEAFWNFVDDMLSFADDETRSTPMSGLEWSRTPEIRAGIAPIVADRGLTAQFLASKGLFLSRPALALFLDFVTDRYVDALNLLERHARNDYSADEASTDFPKFRNPKERSREEPSPWQLFEAWVAARKPAQASIDRWMTVFRDLEEVFAGPKAQPLNTDTAQKWSRAKITKERSAATVNDTWVSAAHTIYKWATRERLIKHNPFADVHVTVPKKIRLRKIQYSLRRKSEPFFCSTRHR